MYALGIIFFRKLVKILQALTIFFKMNTHNDALLQVQN